jgi:Amt family ammonium transporter
MGMILTAIFAQGENASLLHGGWGVFGSHMLVLIGVSAFTFFGSLLLYLVVNWFIPIRVSEKSELIGLDKTQHDEQFL